MAGLIRDLADAVAGVDREGANYEGQIQRSELDERKAQTESAFALARQRQLEATNLQREREMLDMLAEMDPGALAQNIGMVTASGQGSSYAGAQLGANRYQEHGFREQLADPAMDPAARAAAASALAPSAYIGSLGDDVVGGSGPLELVVDPETGQTVYSTRADAVGRQPGARPSATAGATATANQRNINDLVGRGVPEDLAISWVYNLDRDPRIMHSQIYRDLLRNVIYTPQEAMERADEYIEYLYGPTALEDADRIFDQPSGSRDLGADVTGAPAGPAGGGGGFGSPDEVADALAAGELTEEQALRILVDEFGFAE